MARKLGAVAILIATLVCWSTAQAHHSFAMFNLDRIGSVTGTVAEWRWTNPHSWLELMVSNPDGTQTHYRFESRPIYLLTRMRVTPFTLMPGQIVTVTYNPLRDGENGGSLITATTQSGRLLIPRGLPRPIPGGGAAATAAELP